MSCKLGYIAHYDANKLHLQQSNTIRTVTFWQCPFRLLLSLLLATFLDIGTTKLSASIHLHAYRSLAHFVRLQSKADRFSSIKVFKSLSHCALYEIFQKYCTIFTSKFIQLHLCYVSGMSDGFSIHSALSDLSELSLPDYTLDIDLCTLGFSELPNSWVSGYQSTQVIQHLLNCNHLI